MGDNSYLGRLFKPKHKGMYAAFVIMCIGKVTRTQNLSSTGYSTGLYSIVSIGVTKLALVCSVILTLCEKPQLKFVNARITF